MKSIDELTIVEAAIATTTGLEVTSTSRALCPYDGEQLARDLSAGAERSTFVCGACEVGHVLFSSFVDEDRPAA